MLALLMFLTRRVNWYELRLGEPGWRPRGIGLDGLSG